MKLVMHRDGALCLIDNLLPTDPLYKQINIKANI